MGAPFAEVWPGVEGLDGWLTREQALALHEAARAARPGEWIVEIGSHRGKSTILLARAAADGVHVLAVDPFGDPRWGGGDAAYAVFRANLDRAAVAGRVTHARSTSAEAATAWPGGPIALLYVDGAHDRRSVEADIDAWEPFVRRGGTVAFHDAFSSPGVTAALLRRHLGDRRFRYVRSVRSLVLLVRDDVGTVAAAGSALRLALRLGYLARNLAVKASLRQGWKLPARLLGHDDPHFPY